MAETPQKTEANLQKEEKNISNKVLNQIQEFTKTGEIQIPPNYSPENSIKGAWILLGDQGDVLTKCSNGSIATALFKMCMEGLSAIKGQGYFIPYGDKLTWIRNYNGAIALARRVGGVSDVTANVVFEGDKFEFGVNEEGYQYLIVHKPSLTRDMDKIIGAYAIVIYKDSRKNLEYMTMDEKQGATKGASPAHQKFPQEMAKKTVIQRACKSVINSSDDSYLSPDGQEEFNDTEDIAHEVVDEVQEQTGTKQIEFEEPDYMKSQTLKN